MEVLPQRLSNTERLRELKAAGEIDVFSAHDLVEFTARRTTEALPGVAAR